MSDTPVPSAGPSTPASISSTVDSAPSTPPSSSPTQSSGASQTQTQTTAEEKFRLKISGEERELTRAEMEKYTSMGFDAHSKWKEAADLKKANEALLKQMKENPKEFFSKHAKELGFDLQAFSMESLEAQVQADIEADRIAAMSPEERQQLKDQEELEQYRSKDKLTKTEQAKQQELLNEQSQVAADQQYAQETKQGVQDALKAAGLPYSQFTWNSTLQYMATAMNAGHEDITPEQVIHLVQRDYHQSFDGVFQGEDEEVLSRLGDEKIARIQQAVIKKAKGGGGSYEAKPSQVAPKTPQQPKKMTSYEFDDHLEDIKDQIRSGKIKV